MQPIDEARQYWDSEAETFDNEADHGLRDPRVRQAWMDLLRPWLPPHPASILDIGCGTGSISLILAELGHQVLGIDLSPAMLVQAERKAREAGLSIAFMQMDAFKPDLDDKRFELLFCRHLLWAMADPKTALARWSSLLAPGGRMILIEGFWTTGDGLHAEQVVDALPDGFGATQIEPLSALGDLWEGNQDDERYLVIADRVS